MCAFPKSGPVTWRGMCAGSLSTSNLLIYFCISWYAGFLMAKCWVKWPLAGTSALFCMLSVEALKVKPANWGSQALWWVVWHLPWWWDRAPPATFSASPLEAVCQVNLRNWVPCHSKKKKKQSMGNSKKCLARQTYKKKKSSYCPPPAVGGALPPLGEHVCLGAGMVVTQHTRKALLMIWTPLWSFSLKKLQWKCCLSPFGEE